MELLITKNAGSRIRVVIQFAIIISMAMVTSNVSDAVQQSGTESSTSDEEAIRAELLELRDQVINAFDARDLDALIKHIGPDAIFTWQNADRNRGPEEFRAFYDKMMNGDNSLVVDVQSIFEIDGTSQLYGDSTAIACGSIKDNFQLRDGKDFTLNSKWTATFAKSNDEWKIVSYHVSANIFENPILTVAKSYLVTFATVGAVLGFLLGGLMVWFIMYSTQKHVAAGTI